MAERSQYLRYYALPTRWKDIDIYGHVNNVEYYSYFDTAINTYLIEHGGLDPRTGEVIGVCAESHCKFVAELRFPQTVEAGLRVEHLGRTSVRYGIGLFGAGEETPAAEGWFVHVFVNREQRRPGAMPPRLRGALEALVIEVVTEAKA